MGRPLWFDFWAAEHRAAREGVICMDMSFMSKFLVQGLFVPGAVNLRFIDLDRVVLGGIVPTKGALRLDEVEH